MPLHQYGLEVEYRFNLPKMSQLFMVMSHIRFFPTSIHGTTSTCPFDNILKRCCPSQQYILTFEGPNVFPRMSIPHPTPYLDP